MAKDAVGDVLSHVVEDERLLFAVAVLLQSQTFPLQGPDVEERMETLLAVERGSLAEALCMARGDFGLSLAHLELPELERLLEASLDYGQSSWQSFQGRLLAQYSGVVDFAATGRRCARESGLCQVVELGGRKGAGWAKIFTALPVSQVEVLQRLQLVAGELRPVAPLPLSAALLRLANLRESLILDLRHEILSRHHSMSHVFAEARVAGKLQNGLGKLLLDDFRNQFSQVLDGVSDGEEALKTLFAACDAQQDGAIDLEELQQALSIAAPPAGLSRLRTQAILQFQGWKAALNSVGVVEEQITSARFLALAANLDIAYEDAMEIYRKLSAGGSGVVSTAQLGSGLDFGLHEFALRVWLALDAGTALADVAKRLQAAAFEGELSLKSFREVCDRHSEEPPGPTSSQGVGNFRLAPSSKRIPSLKCQPSLTEQEIEAAYQAFKAKYGSVSLGAIRAELNSNTAFTDVLALDRSTASIGETMVVRYRVPRELQSQLRENSFISLVPSNMVWMPGGGGCWMLGRQTVTEMTGPKFGLNRNGDGVLRVQVWPGVTTLEQGSADLRIFSSPDGMSIGKQVGSSARFQLRPPAPSRVMIEKASLSPSSLRLLWEAPNPPMGREQQFRYVVRGKPIGLDIEQEAVHEEQAVWSHVRKKVTKFETHRVEGLLPGVRYRFQVHAVSKTRPNRDATRQSTHLTPEPTPREGQGLESLASPGLEVTMPQRPAPPQPSHVILVERGLGGSFTLRWGEHESALAMAQSWDYEVYWTVPTEEPPESCCQYDQEDHRLVAVRSVWRYPGAVFFRKLQGTVEAQLQPPEADSLGLQEVRFAVRAVDPVSRAVSLMGDLGPAVALPTAAEAILRDVEAVNQLGAGAVAAGGFKRFLEDAEDAGLIGSGLTSEVELRRQLFAKVEEAGGLQEMLEALQELQMEHFKDACEVVRAIEEGSELTRDEASNWTEVVRLVAKAGGAKRFGRALSSVELQEVLGSTQRLAQLGIFQGKSDDHSLRDALIGGEEQQLPQLFSKIQEALGGVALDERQVSDLSSALAIMARRRVQWTSFLELVVAQGGAQPLQPLVSYCQGQAKELHAALKGSSMDAEELIDFLKTAAEAEFVGQAADPAIRQDFLARVSEAGGASVLYSSLQGMDLKALRPALMVARAAKLHRESCLQVTAGSISRADAWHKLVEIVESKWGGPQAFLAHSGELYDSHRALEFEKREESAFDGLVEQIGGRLAASELLRITAGAGGVQHVMKALGPVQLSQVCSFLESLRRGGGRFEDLEKLSSMTAQAGGLTRLVRHMETVQDTSKLGEVIDYGGTFQRHGFVDLPSKDREKHAEVLVKVLSETKNNLGRFLKLFEAVKLSTLMDLVPLLVAAGIVRSKGQPQSDDEVLAAGESLLRWLARAGGAFRVGAAVYQLDARCFLKLMEQVQAMGLDQLAMPGLMKVSGFLTDLARRSGSLEDFLTLVGEMDLIEVIGTLNAWRHIPPALESPDDEAEDAEAPPQVVPPGPTADEAREVMATLEALRLVAQQSGLEGLRRLVRCFEKVDRLERLERGVELLDNAKLVGRQTGRLPDLYQLSADFEPWNHLVAMVNSFGGPERFNQSVEAVNLQHFDECLEVLNAAGLTRKSMKFEDDGSFSLAIAQWKEVLGILVSTGGPALFLESMKGIAVEDFLRMVGLLRKAGLARHLDDEEGAEMCRRPSFTYGYGESGGRIRNEMLQDFVNRIIQAGGFHAFWHALKGVDLTKLKSDLHCLQVVRRKLQELIAEDWWLAVHDAEGLEELLHSHLAERKRRADDLTLRQRQELVKRFKEVGGAESFLDSFSNINLALMYQQHEALEKARIKEVAVIEALGQIGSLVKHKVEHLQGLQSVAHTLVRWGDRHYRGEEPVRLWKAMHQQVTWLLTAIEENGALLKATVNTGSHPGKEPELTPARLAQFLQALRPVGGVPGFLAAFRGLDFSTAASQARILHDACVRSSETTKRLAMVYRLLRYSLAQLRGLEHFLRSFAGPVFAEAGTQGSQERLLVAERWQRLTSYLSQAAGREPGTGSGPDQVVEVVKLGLRLSEAGGLKATEQDWDQLCQEIRATGLQALLSRLRAPRVSSAPRGVRHSLPPCVERPDVLDVDSAEPLKPRRGRPQSAARSRSCSEPFRSQAVVPGWSPGVSPVCT